MQRYIDTYACYTRKYKTIKYKIFKVEYISWCFMGKINLCLGCILVDGIGKIRICVNIRNLVNYNLFVHHRFGNIWFACKARGKTLFPDVSTLHRNCLEPVSTLVHDKYWPTEQIAARFFRQKPYFAGFFA